MEKFELTDEFKELVGFYKRNLVTIAEADSTTTRTSLPVYDPFGRESIVTGSPEEIINTANANLSLFPMQFHAAGLTHETWDDFLNRFYFCLPPKIRDELFLDIARTNPDFADEIKGGYFELLLKIDDIKHRIKQHKKEPGTAFTQADLADIIDKHFTDEVGRFFKRRKVNPYAQSTINNYANNPQATEGLLGMSHRLHELKRARTKRNKKIDRVMAWDGRDDAVNGSMLNYRKAFLVYEAYKAYRRTPQESQDSKTERERVAPTASYPTTKNLSNFANGLILLVEERLDLVLGKETEVDSAVQKLMPYFEGVLPEIRISQREADRLACEELSRITGMPYVTEARGSPREFEESARNAKLTEILQKDRDGYYRVKKNGLKDYILDPRTREILCSRLV